MEVRRGEGGISSKVASQPSIPITGDHRRQHVAPVMGAMDGAGAQRASLQVAELDENEQEPVVGAAELAIVDRALMVAIGWADARIHVENHFLRRTAGPSRVFRQEPAPAKAGDTSLKGVAQALRVSRNTVRKVVRSGQTGFFLRAGGAAAARAGGLDGGSRPAAGGQ